MVQDLEEEDFCRQPSRVAPPIGWHLWHIARVDDTMQADIYDHTQVWERDNMVTMFQLDPNKLGTRQMGPEMSHEDAVQVTRAIGKSNIVSYSQNVFTLLSERIDGMELEDLTVLKINPKGIEQTVHERILAHISHGERHLGMIEALIGVMFDREGTATN